jgi:hypothetical protein
LFTDNSKVYIISVLLYNGIKFPSASLAHAASMKGSYENMEPLLERFQHEKYIWNICGDLKFIAALLGLQIGYTKLC